MQILSYMPDKGLDTWLVLLLPAVRQSICLLSCGELEKDIAQISSQHPSSQISLQRNRTSYRD